MMKRILLIMVCSLLQLAVFAQLRQDVRAMHTKIADLLAQQPAADKAALKANMEAMTAMGEEGITGMAAMLNAPGKGDNTALEYALGGYAFYVTQPGLEAVRAKASAAYCKALQQVKDKENKAFLLVQLQYMGDGAAVKFVDPYLLDERLCDPAARTLVKINTPEAKQAIANAIGKMSGRNKLILEQALGDANAADRGHAGVLKESTAVQWRTAALYETVKTKGDQSLPQLLAAVNDGQPQYREAAFKFAAPYVIKNPMPWIQAMEKAKGERKAALIAMLGHNKITEAFRPIMIASKDKDTLVRFAAIKAMAQTGGKAAVPALLELMKKGDEQRIAAVLKTIEGAEVAAQSAAVIAQMQPAAQVALIDILADRKADQYFNNLLLLTKSSNEKVRAAAFAALKNTADGSQLETLFGLLSQAEHPADIKALQAAVINASTDAAPVIAQMQEEPVAKQERYYQVLAGIGGADALNVVSAASEKGNAAAVKALISWKDMSAAPALIKIARKDPSQKNTALQGYVRMAKAAATPDQRLLMLRNAMELNPEPALKKTILQQTEQCKTFPALVFAGNYLEDAALQQEAAQAVMNIALADKSYSGMMVRNLLEKTSGLLKGGDADYQREAIRKYLAEMPSTPGFQSIFNGKDLSGWKGLVADPIKRAKMDAATLQKEQAIADARMRTGWKVEDGRLIFTGEGDNLCTTKKYGDFEMFVDWKITKDGDAGIYLRGTPQVQIWDTARRSVGAEVGSGGLYNNQQSPSKPTSVADNEVGEWNTFRIIMKGDRVTVYLNGEQVVDNVMLENYWNRKLPIFPEEQLELQAHGTYVAYRNLYVREFEQVKPFELSAQEKKEGYKVLFDGTNMHQWTGNTISYVIDNGDLVCTTEKGNGRNLFTKDEYSDFIFRFEFQLTPGANNGLGIRAPLEGDAAYAGMELQILDNEADIYKNLHEYQYHGSVYGVIPAKRGFLKPVGEWNYEQVTVKGTRITVELNGAVIVDGDIAGPRDNGTLDHKDHPGLKREKGHIGFLGHGSVVRFRNIRVKELASK